VWCFEQNPRFYVTDAVVLRRNSDPLGLARQRNTCCKIIISQTTDTDKDKNNKSKSVSVFTVVAKVSERLVAFLWFTMYACIL